MSKQDHETKKCPDCGEDMIRCEHCDAWLRPCYLRMGMSHVCDMKPQSENAQSKTSEFN